MNGIRGFFFVGLLLWSLTGTACQRPVHEQESPTADVQTRTLLLTPEQQGTIGLTTEKVMTQKARPTITSFGRVIPRLQGRVQVASPVAGRITSRSANIIPALGASVQRGQLLAEVEQTYTASEQVQLDVGAQGAAGTTQEAKAALEAALAEYQRSQRLFQDKIVSRKRVEEAKAAWLQTQSRYETAQRQQASYRAAIAAGGESPRRFPLITPLAGTVVQAEITAGQQVDTSTPLFIIADLSKVWIEAPVFEGDLDRINRKSTATIHSVGDEPLSWTGKPIYAGAVVDPIKRTVNLLYAVDNISGQLRLGMSVTVVIPAGSEKQVMMVPEAALIESGKGKGIMYMRRSPTVFTEEEVTIGMRQDGLAAVEGEVKEGEEIVVVGVTELFGKVPGRLLAEGE